jgi:glycosyltransferase involved in cell wall biosynthesis
LPVQPCTGLMGGRVLMGHLFFTGGGAACVARNLAVSLPSFGWQTTIISASLRNRDAQRDARVFFRGLDVRPIDLTDAIDADDPMRTDPPVPPLLTARPGRRPLFAALDDATYEHHVRAAVGVLEAAEAAVADVLHLHHLTPFNEAAHRAFTHVPVVGHLHGGELLLLEEMQRRGRAQWPHAPAWTARLRRWAAACTRIVLVSDSQLERAQRLLGVVADDCVTVANGFDPRVFRPIGVDRATHWRRTLVDAPRGWVSGGDAGSVAYDERDLEAFVVPNPVLVHVGRFAAVKRLDLLIEAYALARRRFATRAPLVLVGAAPGECEGEHPLDTTRRLGVDDVFLAGWYPQEDLPAFLAASDVLVLPSVREQFGLVAIEAMACGRPVIAADALGPAEIVRDGDTGWLVAPGDVAALAEAMVAAVNEPAERRRRVKRAAADAYRRFRSLPLAQRMAEIYDSVLDEQQGGRP